MKKKTISKKQFLNKIYIIIAFLVFLLFIIIIMYRYQVHQPVLQYNYNGIVPTPTPTTPIQTQKGKVDSELAKKIVGLPYNQLIKISIFLNRLPYTIEASGIRHSTPNQPLTKEDYDRNSNMGHENLKLLEEIKTRYIQLVVNKLRGLGYDDIQVEPESYIIRTTATVDIIKQFIYKPEEWPEIDIIMEGTKVPIGPKYNSNIQL